MARGFTLLESLIALAIASLALVALYDAGIGGIMAIKAANRRAEAVARADSRLAMVLHGGPIAAGNWSGDDGGGFSWRVHVAPTDTIALQPDYRPSSAMAQNYHVTLYSVTVWISWRDGGNREIRLDTEQIGPGAP